ncbi:HAD-IC family P-type ATPase [Burkholderia oklahomensis]|uniref:HAD-IC family P-type ATPase n=1 Tax=Burkholderia oklahomensis TaxID=342113 RepID=UPI00264A5864|nr:HAD-IC family P-type ATPase [Burkholderia oklahomensis]MDN7675663.1 HAD-IC family P-type ATPase [Burkholderia oklahomensis]
MDELQPTAALPDGLGSSDVAARRQRGDVNRMMRRASRSLADIVRTNVLTRFNALLGSLCAVVLIAGPWQDALFGGVLVANSLIGIVQEWRAKRALDRLTLLHQPRARVRRDGRTIEIDVADIVKDDLIAIERGEQIVVDGVVAASSGLQVDESLLTGESEPQDKTCGASLLSASFVVAGQGWYQATAVGQEAWARRLAAQARRFKPVCSELAAGINRMLRYVGWTIAPLSVLLVATQLLRQMPFAQAVLVSAGGVVGMVPEGLVLLTSVALAVGAMRLARRGTLMQELPAIETLARVDVVCIDKTGTLTQGEPVLEQIEVLAGDSNAHHALAALVLGEPAPNATLRAISSSCSVSPGWQATHTVPFSSARKWAGASFGEHGTWVLGAPDILLAGAAMADNLRDSVSRHAREGRRVLLLARSDLPLADDALPQALTPVALVLLAERIRDDAPGAVAWFVAQGVSLKVISGDRPDTAAEVARRVGITFAQTGVDARALPDSGDLLLGEVMERESVFGRVSPQQKAAMVAALRRRGHVVAMVGDGVNDLLALKEADIGIAMGGGSSAASAVAQAVLTDNRFASLPAIVNEGRRVIGNIERVANLFVTKTVYVMLLAFAVGIADLAFPFLPRHLTLTGSLTIGIPAFFLSLEPSAERAKSGFVERVLRFAVPAGVLAAIATFAAYVVALSYLHGTLDQARTAATVTLCAIALWILAQLARPLSASRLGIVVGMATAFAAVIVVARLRIFFAIEALPVPIWLGVAGIAVLACSGMHALTTRSTGSEAPPPSSGKAAPAKPQWRALFSLWRQHLISVTATLVLLVGSVWLFLGVLEDVISRDPLLQADLIVWRILQDSRPAWPDSVMTGLSELGDAAVVVPIVLVVLSWLIWHRLWRAALYWLAAVGGAEVIVKLLKLLLHRARPNPFAAGIEGFSFPSSHATLAVVTYGFLAFLLCEGQRHRTRLAISVTATIAVTLIATSRLYLGVHWVSDVVAGLSLGLAWVAVLVIAYSLQKSGHIRSTKLTVIIVMTLLAAATLHIVRHHDADLALYAQTRQPERMTVAQWHAGGWRSLHVGRVAVVGRIDEPFTVQWAGSAAAIARALKSFGWQTASNTPVWLPWPVPHAVVLKFHDGALPAMTFVQGDAASPDMQSVLRLWPSDAVIERPCGSPDERCNAPVWVGTVTRERMSAARAWTFSVPSVDEDFTSPASAFAQRFPGARSVTRDDAVSVRFRHWDRRVWLVCAAAPVGERGSRAAADPTLPLCE